MPRILETMAEKLPGEYESQDPLEQLLDEESDEAFGLPKFKEHLADSLTPAILKDWTAADFASIYVRFRPHLERHAKRFLVNPSQVEEVVQDAFLYLMTTLPELDSELGVLKFMKWKTRLLALDVIRANSRASFAPLDDQPDLEAKTEEFSLELERADDAAIVALAMAKLQPRHREALIATLYEEKANEVVAAQMGLNENAFRQLLFRARSAFKKALVGEAETAGKSASEILSIAARKAAQDSGKYISAAGAFLLVLAISIGVLPNFSQPSQEQIAAPQPTASSQTTAPQEASEAEPDFIAEPESVETDASTSVETQPVVAMVPGEAIVAAPAAAIVEPQPSAQPEEVEGDSERGYIQEFMNDALGDRAINLLTQRSDSTVLGGSGSTAGNLVLTNNSGLTAYLTFDLSSEQGIQYSWFDLEVDGLKFVAVPKSQASETRIHADGSSTIYFVATDLLIGDTHGIFGYIASDETSVSRSALRVEVTVSASGSVTSAKMALSPRT